MALSRKKVPHLCCIGMVQDKHTCETMCSPGKDCPQCCLILYGIVHFCIPELSRRFPTTLIAGKTKSEENQTSIMQSPWGLTRR